MSIAENLADRRVSLDQTRPTAGRHVRGEEAADRVAALRLAVFAALSVAVYYLAFAWPYSLHTLWMMHQVDLQRMAAFDPAARWFMFGGILTEGLLYYLALRTVRQMRPTGAAWVIVVGGALASCAVLLYFYPLGSTDIWDYIIHGRMLAFYNANPFVNVAAQYPRDVFAWYAGWPFATSAYGPFWEVLAALTARLAGNGVVENVVAFKLLEIVFLAASVGTVVAILRRVAPERALAGALLLAWNPLVLYETVGNGHNDIVMVFWILVAVHMMVDRRYTLAILALVAGTLVKFIPILMVPAAGLIALRELPTQRNRLTFLAVTAAAAIGLIMIAYQPFWAGPQVLSVGRRENMFIASLPAAIVAYLTPRIGFLAAAARISKIAALLTSLYALWEGVRASRDRTWHSFARSAFNISMFYLLVTCMWFWDWYAIWPLALAALLPEGFATRLAHVFAVASLTRPLVWDALFFTPAHSATWVALRLGPSMLALPWIYTLYAGWDRALSWAQQRLARQNGTAQPAYAAVRTNKPYGPRDREDQ